MLARPGDIGLLDKNNLLGFAFEVKHNGIF